MVVSHKTLTGVTGFNENVTRLMFKGCIRTVLKKMKIYLVVP